MHWIKRSADALQRVSTTARKDRADAETRRLYAWEDKWRDWNISTLTLSECRAIIRAVCERYRIEAPKVTQHRKRSLSYSQGDTISLQAKGPRVIGGEKGGKNMATTLHEVAHYLTDRIYGTHLREHGPEFVAVYLKLLVQSHIAPADAIYYSAKRAGLVWRKS